MYMPNLPISSRTRAKKEAAAKKISKSWRKRILDPISKPYSRKRRINRSYAPYSGSSNVNENENYVNIYVQRGKGLVNMVTFPRRSNARKVSQKIGTIHTMSSNGKTHNFQGPSARLHAPQPVLSSVARAIESLGKYGMDPSWNLTGKRLRLTRR